MRNKAGTHPNVHEAIHRRTRELADQAPPLTPEQLALLEVVFRHESGGGG